ncbi:MAG: tetratricopeptide repeat protein, partial [Anaerolineae bacterium]
AKTAITQGDLETGQALAQDALEAAPDHPTLQADALDSLALVADKLGDMHTALAHYEKALAIHEALGARDEVAAMLNMIATVYSKRYKLEEAMRYGERALTIQREVGDPGRLGAVLVNLGVTTKKAGDYERALGYYQEARAIFKRIGHRLGHAIAWMNIGTVTELLGRDLESHAAFDHALRIAQEMDMVPLYLYVLLGKATLAAKAGDHVRAAEMAGTVMEHGQKDEDVMNQIRALSDERITLPEAAREAALKRGRDRSPQEAVDLLQTTT